MYIKVKLWYLGDYFSLEYLSLWVFYLRFLFIGKGYIYINYNWVGRNFKEVIIYNWFFWKVWLVSVLYVYKDFIFYINFYFRR